MAPWKKLIISITNKELMRLKDFKKDLILALDNNFHKIIYIQTQLKSNISHTCNDNYALGFCPNLSFNFMSYKKY